MMFDGHTGLVDTLNLSTARLFSRPDLQRALYGRWPTSCGPGFGRVR
jgi:hypothetical protein